MNQNLLCQYIYHRKLSKVSFIFRPLQLSPPMASCSTFLTTLPNLRNYHNTIRIRHSRPHMRLVIRAADTSQPPGSPRRLVDLIRLIPDLSRNYFKNRPRRALFGGISLLGGFYVAQTISLSFGALGVNDVIAAVLCVLLTEYATKFYYSQPKVTFPVALLNNFKMGFTYGLFIDAFKLAS